MRWPNRIFYSLVLLALVQSAVYYPQMPEIVASHWDGLGEPNDWPSRNVFFGMYLAMIGLVVLVFVLAPRWRFRGRRGLKIPHADYWLAPERIDATRHFFRRQMLIMGSLHLLLAITVMQFAILANFSAATRLHQGIMWALGLYFIALLAWLARFFLHFRYP